MDVVSEATERGVTERQVILKVGDESVPGIVWLPEGATATRPTVVLGHGGVVHKRAPEVLGLARRLVRHRGYAAIALDAPEHGDRITNKDAARAARRALQARIDQGPGGGIAPMMDETQAKGWNRRVTTHVSELSALLDDTESSGLTDGRLGYWGMSMGTGIGLRFVASDQRIKAAVLGLSGLNSGMGDGDFEAAARSLRVPILFLMQWNDELVPRQSGLDLFEAIGSEEKTLHSSPGGHVQVPVFENDAAELFFSRHLGPAA